MLKVIILFIVYLPFIISQNIKDNNKNKGKVHLYGIQSYYGLPGQGKTISMCRELKRLRKKYGNEIIIMTNFYYHDQDLEFKSWTQLLEKYDKTLVVAWDEVQNEFNSRDFKNFPIQLLTQLTQVRKGNGIRLLTTSQRYHFVDKNFRSLADTVVDCHCILGCYVTLSYYDPMDYEQLVSSTNVDQKMSVRPKKRESFLQNDSLRDSYDSYKMLESACGKEYMSRTEIAQIDGVSAQ